MRHFCTYFDSNYALRGLTLFRSLEQHCGEFILHVLCCDEAVFETIHALQVDNLRAYRLREVEAFEPRLASIKPVRSRAEYLWTLSPIWPLFLLETRPDIDLVCYLDADLFFFASDEPLWKEFGGASVLIIEHRFAPGHEAALINGRFNVGLIAYRRDENGLACLNWYRERCLEWCYDRHEDGKYGDQKYLDEFPALFGGVHIARHPGVNVAPWNWMNGMLSCDENGPQMNGEPVIFYHFHGFKLFGARLFDPCRSGKLYGEMPNPLARCVHLPYVRAMAQTVHWMRARGVAARVRYDAITAYGPRIFVSKVRRGKLFFGPPVR